MKLLAFGSCEKKLDYIGKVIVPSCMCVFGGGGGGVGDVVSLWSSFIICFFRQKATMGFHSLKDGGGGGGEAFFGK